jgi:hypothetical protein
MVFGLVSALPGAKLDASLPQDGLIQIEARNGQRFFLSRSSLVALTITRLPKRQEMLAAGASAEMQEAALLTPTPFVMRENVFDRSTAEINTLPTEAADALINVLSSARTRLRSEPCDETHINVGIQRLLRSGTTHLPLPAGSRRLLDFIIWLAAPGPRPASIEVCLPDRWYGRNADAPSARNLAIVPNTALIFPAANGLNALDLHIAAEIGPAIIVSGSLCEGVGVDSH